jgi:drug/metabolite transporter (DMT)-like permease
VAWARAGALAAIVMWGLSFVATKSLLRELSPVSLIFARFAIGTAGLLAILAARGDRRGPPRAAWPGVLLMGFVGVFVHQMLQAHGLALTTAVRTGWLIGTVPIWTAALSALLVREALGSRKILGLALGTAGAVLVVTRGQLAADVFGLPTTRGDLLIVASTLNWAAYTVLGRATLRNLGSASATTWSMLAGWVMLAPFFAAAGGWREVASLSAGGWAALAFLGVGCSALGYLFWYAALEHLQPTQVASFLYLEPLVTLAAAVTLLGEPVAAATIAGGALVMAGVSLVQRS